MVNHATMLLQGNKLDESISLFTEVLNQADQGSLGVKYESASHFNLGVAHLRRKNISKATIEFNSAIDTWPASLYALRAQQALERMQHKEHITEENKPADQ